jgi:hypothetical protein
MFELQIDAAEFERKVADMGAAMDQLPFALSRALNDAVTEARHTLVDQTWPQHVTVRNSSFIGYALRTEFSTKYDLRVAIYDQSKGNVHLQLHNVGGTKQAKGRFTIPTAAVKLGVHGARANQRPANLANKVVIGNAIYQRQGRGKKNKKLVKMYTLASSVNQPADVPFQQDFETAMRASVTAHFPERMMQAMQTRR